MWKQKIGISLLGSYAVPTPQAIRMIAAAGFDAVSPVWSEKTDLDEVIAAARENGLAVQSLHAPFGKVDRLWSRDEEESAPVLARVMASLEECIRHRIPVLVAHVWIGFEYEFNGDDLYFGNFEKLVSRAAEQGVRIAFENTEGQEYLFALMEHFEGNDAVGFCWDSGHELCYNHSEDLLARFGDRLLMTHLNDNLGISRFDGSIYWTDDLHLLPYDGVADWEDNIARLRASKPLEFLNFELNLASKPDRHENDRYGQMPLEQYLAEAYTRACRIAYRYGK